MKKILLLLIIVNISTLISAQNPEVDKKDGFKSIKLGSHISEFKGLQRLNSENSDRSVYLWNTSDPELKFLFDEKINGFYLTFGSDNNLQIIQVVKIIDLPMSNSSVHKKFYSIANKLNTVLGKFSEVLEDEMGLLWGGKEILISLSLEAQEVKFVEGKVIGSSLIKYGIMALRPIEKDLEKGF